MNIREILNKIKEGFSWFVGNHESQFVNEEDNPRDVIEAEVKAGRMSKTDAQAILDSLNSVDGKGKTLETDISRSVPIYPADIGGIKVENTPKASTSTTSGGKGIKKTNMDREER